MNIQVAAKDKVTAEPVSVYVHVALPIPLNKTFVYSIPERIKGRIEAGTRVLVPFGPRHLTGYVVDIADDPADLAEDLVGKIKEVHEVLDETPLIRPDILELTKWTADYYACSEGELLKAALPAGLNARVERGVRITKKGIEILSARAEDGSRPYEVLELLNREGTVATARIEKVLGRPDAREMVEKAIVQGFAAAVPNLKGPAIRAKTRRIVRLRDASAPFATSAEGQSRVLECLSKAGGELPLSVLLEAARVSRSPVRTLQKLDVVEILDQEERRDPFAGSKPAKRQELTLTGAQTAALKAIESGLEASSYKAFLLHGVTGSGKTEVYIRAMLYAVKRGKTALMMVPEIALTPVFSQRLRSVFGDDVAIVHSALSRGERFDEWRRIYAGEARVVIGTRSAVFAPLRDPGLIIIDEEHDTSYRQNEMPFYHGRDVALVRAKLAGAVAVMGSATPALESFRNAETGKYEYLQLPDRIGNRPLASAELVDLREVFKETGKDTPISPLLASAIEETRARGEQSIILLNRRGFSQFVLCRKCGETIKCRNCEITLTFHRHRQRLVCHYCDYAVRPPGTCPSCESEYLFFLGEGTEQIEEALNEQFPGLRVARVDRDSTRKRKRLERILADFSAGRTDILIGTQMLAKGHDFPNVTLVGVISVDAGLSLPDFRAAERTFQLLTQVAGRAGRGDSPGRVLIQSYYPEHYALRHAKTQSYEAFYREEIAFRKRLFYPPFVALASIIALHPDRAYACDNARILRDCLNSANDKGDCIILGPAPAALSRLKGKYRMQLILKARNRRALRNALENALSQAESRGCDMKTVFAEIDPVHLL